jgi:hypothetical protein
MLRSNGLGSYSRDFWVQVLPPTIPLLVLLSLEAQPLHPQTQATTPSPPADNTVEPTIQSNLFKRDPFKRDSGLSGTLSFAL